MKKQIQFFLSLSILILIACSSQKSAYKKQEEVLPGFTLLSSPNNLEKPGTVFAIDKKGKRQPLIQLQLPVDSSTNEIAQDSGKRSSNFSVLLSFLGTEKSKITAENSFKLSKNIKYNLKLEGSTLHRVELLKVSQELENVKKQIQRFSELNNMADYQFYVVTEAVKAKSLLYKFDSKDSTDIGLKTDIKKIINANPKVTWNSDRSYDLSYNLKSSLYVFAKYFSLTIMNRGGQEGLSIDRQVDSIDPLHK